MQIYLWHDKAMIRHQKLTLVLVSPTVTACYLDCSNSRLWKRCVLPFWA